MQDAVERIKVKSPNPAVDRVAPLREADQIGTGPYERAFLGSDSDGNHGLGTTGFRLQVSSERSNARVLPDMWMDGKLKILSDMLGGSTTDERLCGKCRPYTFILDLGPMKVSRCVVRRPAMRQPEADHVSVSLHRWPLSWGCVLLPATGRRRENRQVHGDHPIREGRCARENCCYQTADVSRDGLRDGWSTYARDGVRCYRPLLRER